jgi:hypothetical protein
MKRNLTVAAAAASLASLVAAAGALAATPKNHSQPTISGTAKVGSTLTVSNGGWYNTPTTYAYQWQRCASSESSCTDIAGATSQRYTVTSADNGDHLRALVTASNADGKATAASGLTALVGGSVSGGPVNTARPSITGDAVVGSTLTASSGTWTGASSFTYRWLQCGRFGGSCVSIVGATGRTYNVRLADSYGTLRVAVTAHNTSGTTTVRSAPSDVVQPLQQLSVQQANEAPRITFLSLKRLGLRVYARFRVCDDAAKGVTVFERDQKAGKLAYVRKFTVTPNQCTVATRSWKPAPRFRTRGRFVVTLRAMDKSRASSRFVSRSLVKR